MINMYSVYWIWLNGSVNDSISESGQGGIELPEDQIADNSS
jgi:hypothetical protein